MDSNRAKQAFCIGQKLLISIQFYLMLQSFLNCYFQQDRETDRQADRQSTCVYQNDYCLLMDQCEQSQNSVASD